MKNYYQRKNLNFLSPSSSSLSVISPSRHHDSNANYLTSTNSSYWYRGSLQLKRWLGRSSTAMPDGICSGFEPQNYLRDRCKKCFRLKSKHDDNNNSNHSIQASTATITATSSTTSTSNGRPRRPVSVASAIGQSPTSDDTILGANATSTSGAVANAILAKKEKRKSWRDKNQNPDEGPDNDVPDSSDTMSMASFKSANSKGMSSAKSLESITSINDTKSMITACSGDSFGNDDERALTPTESECTNDLLRIENRKLEEENSKLKEEKHRLRSKHEPKDAKEITLVQELKERLAEAENIIQDYRDENTVLKCELREIQAPIHNGNYNGNSDLDYKLKETESLCEELMVENENLKSDIRDLQQEIEEMQDQYREEEIEEFRELQRELEQNAKNCRVLQFKLRKAERMRDTMEAERDHANSKLKELTKGVDPGMGGDYSRQRELESELRIAKEVSVRLHNELEAAEEKRCKLEDEVFYYKEKCRELQTQNKWRETRNKADQAAKRHSQEIVEAVDLPADELRKELRDVLERENDLREQLRFTEEDLKRSRNKLTELENENEELLQKLVKITETVGRTNQRRPPMTRSASEGQTELQLEMAATELDQLQTKCDNLEKKNFALTKKMLEMEIDLAKRLQEKGGENGFQLNAELEKDLGRLMATIHELEKKNSELTLQLKKQTNMEFAGSLKVASAPNSPVIGKEKSLQVELRNEQEKRKELEIEIAEYKSMIAKSDNQKLIAMATKVELLQNQLLLANDRCNALHKKALKESNTGQIKYADSLKQRCEILEKQLSEEKSNKTYEKKIEKSNSPPTADEVEHCCIVLASIEAQTNRISKQVDKIDSNGQKDQRRRSLTLDNSATIVAELANVLSELKGVKDVFEAYKASNPNYIKKRETPERDSIVYTNNKVCELCEEKSNTIDSMKDEIGFYKKKNKELTNQVLQTEDRWSREIEKQTHGYRSQIHALDTNLDAVQKKLDEQIHLTESINAQLNEKKRALDEERNRLIKIQIDLEEKQKALQNLEKEQHALREWEIKYKKLEKLFDQEKSKFDADRLRIKSDTAVLKKRTDEAVADLEKLRNSHQRREIMWNEERQRLEKEMKELHERIGSKTDSNEGYEGVIIPVQTLSYKVTRVNGEGVPELKAKLHAADKRIDELEAKVVDLRICKEELESEALRKKISFEREKETLLHKVRQDDKVKIVEIDALQQKFASRMNIMETTNKSLHSQLVQTRRERDHHREAVANYEKRIEEEQKFVAEQTKKINDASQRAQQAEKRVQELEAEVHRLTVELSFSKDAHKADKKLWKIEKNHFNKISPSTENSNDERRITEDALKAAESVQKQYAEYQKLYASEVDRLNKKVKEAQSEMAHKQFESEKIMRELREQIKMLEIDQKNLMQAKEMQTNAREVLQADQERLLQIVQQAEVQKLTRKYKIAAVADQLYGLPEKAKLENDGVVASVISQLNTIREEDSRNFTSNDISSDFDYTQDLISQSSISIKSTQYPPSSRLASRQANPSSYSLGMSLPKDRSFSIDSNSTWAFETNGRGSSPNRRLYPDPPPSFVVNKDRVPEYDKDGRLHYIPKSIARSSSYDRYGGNSISEAVPPSMSASSVQIQTRSTGTWTEDDPDPSIASRNVGTNILYKIRREELSKGTAPSVRNIAKAFESMDPRTFKRGLFSIRKSRSVDTSEQTRNSKHNAIGNNTLRPVTPLNRNTTSMSQIEIGDRPGFHNALPIGPNIANCTLPRNRNPFKNMGAKIVDRVRRSLSRSRRPSEEKLNSSIAESTTNDNTSQMLPPIPTSPPPPHPSLSLEATDKGASKFSKNSKTPSNNKPKKTVVVVKKKASAVP